MMGELEIIQALPLEGFETVVLLYFILHNHLKRIEGRLDAHMKRNGKDHRRLYKLVDTLSRRLAKVER